MAVAPDGLSPDGQNAAVQAARAMLGSVGLPQVTLGPQGGRANTGMDVALNDQGLQTGV